MASQVPLEKYLTLRALQREHSKKGSWLSACMRTYDASGSLTRMIIKR